MIRIYNGSDFILDLSRISELIEIADSVVVKLFTTNANVFCEYSKEDIEDNKIEVTYDRIQGIGEGVITCRYDLGFDNNKYPDLKQNVIGQFTTNYYLASGEIVPSEDDEHILSGVAWGNIVGSIDSQTDLATRLNQKVNNSTFTSAIEEIELDIEGKADIDEVQSGFDSVNDALDLKADLSGLTALQTQVDNLPTSDVISGLNSKIDSHTANTVVHVTQADKNNWNSKQAAGDYATNTKVNQVDTKVDNVNLRVTNLSADTRDNINDLNGAITNIGSRVTSVENNVTNNYLSTSQATATYLTKADAANTYQTKNNYVTNVQLSEQLNDYVRKNDPQVINQTETTVEIQPNVLNVWGEVASLTITFAEGAANQYNEYMIQFESGSAATTLTLPNTVEWLTDAAIEANTTYQISIVNNLGIMEGWQ